MQGGGSKEQKLGIKKLLTKIGRESVKRKWKVKTSENGQEFKKVIVSVRQKWETLFFKGEGTTGGRRFNIWNKKRWSRPRGESESELQNKSELRQEERDTGRQTALVH